nr:immunoglobulin heavy chain junction region [Macaca mulatta]MOX01156.1 immunoglobulin heavy chain junction region [Macaca mulatta]MOX01876.1 immunoglobulin heavy chain junction region [Macaca mulatta]MOX02379.1 immunoglobulin heavy chain junction region [Macaca mulatta]MOX02665.1 immunoglobulin heavy chain junction region [Macaca mulatta]
CARGDEYYQDDYGHFYTDRFDVW